jgi:ABC-type multidrug transport system fused ATPase/permease subunit
MILIRSLIALAVQFAGVAFIAIVFIIMYRSPNFSVAAFAVIVYAVGQIFNQVQSGQIQMHGMGTLAPYLSKLLAARDDAREHIESSGGSMPFAIGKGITFSDVSFAYQGRDAALSKVSFSIPRGALVGLIGPSGAGKTTIADLLDGSIRADDVDVREISIRDWRHHIGYVPQDAILLDDTIEANIAFYDTSISHDDVIAAAKNANIHSFIETLPHQYATVVGDRGTFISGGQRQRVALARALARKPDLLVLDEATSSLDAESESAIKAAVDSLRGTTSVLIIAHRMSSVAGVDRIVVLEKGSVV